MLKALPNEPVRPAPHLKPLLPQLAAAAAELAKLRRAAPGVLSTDAQKYLDDAERLLASAVRGLELSPDLTRVSVGTFAVEIDRNGLGTAAADGLPVNWHWLSIETRPGQRPRVLVDLAVAPHADRS